MPISLMYNYQSRSYLSAIIRFFEMCWFSVVGLVTWVDFVIVSASHVVRSGEGMWSYIGYCGLI